VEAVLLRRSPDEKNLGYPWYNVAKMAPGVPFHRLQLWEIPAEELLAASDVGLIPRVPLTQFDGPPEPIVRQCRARIDRDAPPDEHENLLAVTQFLARLRYHGPKLFQLLGGRKAMIESPLLESWMSVPNR